MLVQLIYVSKRELTCSEKDIYEILQASIRNNRALDITGVLLYSKERFLQVLEGEYKSVMKLYEKIKKDSRHYEAIMIGLRPIKERAFPTWSMAHKSLDMNKIEFKNYLTFDEQLIFEKVLNGYSEDTEYTYLLIKRFFKEVPA